MMVLLGSQDGDQSWQSKATTRPRDHDAMNTAHPIKEKLAYAPLDEDADHI
jgi:hypothetical protein